MYYARIHEVYQKSASMLNYSNVIYYNRVKIFSTSIMTNG